MSFDILCEKIAKKDNPTVMGIDPLPDYIPADIIERAKALYGDTLKAVMEATFEYCIGLVDACADLIPAVKPQSAFFELFGLEGEALMAKIIDYAKNAGLYVILDVKRGDIGSTAAAYAKAYLGKTALFSGEEFMSNVDSITVNPYLGSDGVLPFLDEARKFDKTFFTLVKTSNKSSGEFQDLACENGITLYENVAKKVCEWGKDDITACGFSRIGAVVGATYPMQAKKLRELMPNTFFLVPGYGAQGATAQDIAVSFVNGKGAIVNSSRGIMCAYKKTGENYKDAARNAVIKMRDDINSAIK